MIGRLGRLMCACVLTSGVFALAAGAASATTFFVNGTTGNDTHACTSPGTACKTINGALVRAAADPAEEAPSIEVSAGTYEEDLQVELALAGVTINGAGSGAGGTKIVGPTSSQAVVSFELFAAPATLSNVQVLAPTKSTGAGISSTASLTLDNVAVTMQAPADAVGIAAEELGSLAVNGGGVTMAKETEGAAIEGELVSSTINGATITMEPGSKGSGLEMEAASTAISNSTVNFQAASKATAIGLEQDTATMTNDVINYAGEEVALAFELNGSTSINGLSIAMSNSKDIAPAIEEGFAGGTLDHVQVSGAWLGSALIAEGGTLTLADSNFTTAATSRSTLEAVGLGVGSGLLVQRSVIKAPATATRPALTSDGANLTLDSSEVLGGAVGVLFEQEAAKLRTVTIDGSTIDAGKAGEADVPPVYDVMALATAPTSRALVNVIGSVLFEQQFAALAAGAEASVKCSFTNAPSQTQAASATEGSIACGAGENANSAAEPAALFSAPVTSYQPLPGSVAIDTVPSAAVTLPFGFTPSSTDLVGNPRSESIACTTFQDRGAIELPGHGTPCPPGSSSGPAPAKPLAGVITALSISPSAFLPAPSGATISATKHTAKKKYGAKIGYSDSQGATTTFTVLRKSAGRKQGRSCKKPSKKNNRGKRCTLLVKLGTFTHTDKAGTNSFHFSGRIKGKKLPAGTYELQAIAHDAAGNGPVAQNAFTIR